MGRRWKVEHRELKAAGFQFSLFRFQFSIFLILFFAFPEVTMVGIYPGLGGTYRAARRLGRKIAKWMILTGTRVKAAEGSGTGPVLRIVGTAVLGNVEIRTLPRGAAARGGGPAPNLPSARQAPALPPKTGDER